MSEHLVEFPVGKPCVVERYLPVMLCRDHADKVPNIIVGDIAAWIEETGIPEGAEQLDIMIRVQYVKIV
jgi:hypothetical protein